MKTQSLAPVLFISHGAPTTALVEDAYSRGLREAGRDMQKPRAIVVVSAHGLTRTGVEISSAPKPQLIYDFYGFPDELYRIQYPCPGEPALASKVRGLLSAAGIEARENPEMGLDHGTWVPLLHLFPEADIPVIQVSFPFPSKPEVVWKLGQALAPLRGEGVLLIGSGSATHNLRALDWRGNGGAPAAWAAEFMEWVRTRVTERRFDEILRFESEAPGARQSHPTTEHFYPIFFTLGAGSAEDRPRTLADVFHFGSLSMYSFALDDA